MFIINMRHFSDLSIRMSSPNIRSVNNHKFLSEQIFSPTLPDPKTGTVGGMETEPRELAMSSPWKHPDQSEDRVTSEQADIAETTSGTKNWCAQFPIKKECGRMKSIKSCDDVTLDELIHFNENEISLGSKQRWQEKNSSLPDLGQRRNRFPTRQCIFVPWFRSCIGTLSAAAHIVKHKSDNNFAMFLKNMLLHRDCNSAVSPQLHGYVFERAPIKILTREGFSSCWDNLQADQKKWAKFGGPKSSLGRNLQCKTMSNARK